MLRWTCLLAALQCNEEGVVWACVGLTVKGDVVHLSDQLGVRLVGANKSTTLRSDRLS